MEHPFVGSLADKTDDELYQTINKLQKSMGFVGQNGNYAMLEQLRMAMENYRTELHRRQEKQFAATSGTIQGKIDISS